VYYFRTVLRVFGVADRSVCINISSVYIPLELKLRVYLCFFSSYILETLLVYSYFSPLKEFKLRVFSFIFKRSFGSPGQLIIQLFTILGCTGNSP
jgi:hypothetical protein